jgi:hypothetical protein
MSTRIELPPGCSGITCQDGTRYTGRKGGSVVVDDRHAAAIARSRHGGTGLITAARMTQLGTRTGRWCPACARLWQAWSRTCPRCGGVTTEA